MKFYDKKISTFNDGENDINLIKIALPKLFELASLYLIGSISAAMLSRYSQESVSAVNVSLQVLNLVIIIFNIVLTGGNFVTSYELGRQDRKKAASITGTAVVTAVALAAIAGAILAVFAEGILYRMNLRGEACIMGARYLRVCAVFLPMTVALNFMTTFLICNGHSIGACAVGIVNNAANVVLCWVALFSGTGILPEGADGIAAARIIAQAVALAAGVCIFMRKKCPFKLCFGMTPFKRILKIGFPGGMSSVSYNLAQTVTTAVIAGFGTLVINSKVYYSNILCYVPLVSSSVGSAGGILIGRYKACGDYDAIEKLCRQNLRISLCLNILISVMIYLFRVPLVSIFSAEDYTLKLAGIVMLVDVFVETGRAVNHVFENMYAACGDVKTTMLTSICSCWAGSVLLTYLLGVKLGLGLAGCWIAFAADELFKASVYLIRWKSKKWKRFRI